jgi:hypothetical protein
VGVFQLPGKEVELLAIYPDAQIDFDDPNQTREAWEKYLAHR